MEEAVALITDQGHSVQKAADSLGIRSNLLYRWQRQLEDQKLGKSLSEDEINALIKERNLARDNKDFKRSDEIRDLLNDKGILIEDKENSTTWKYI